MVVRYFGLHYTITYRETQKRL